MKFNITYLVLPCSLLFVSCIFPFSSSIKEAIPARESTVIAEFIWQKNFSALPLNGQSERIPWNGYYWPQYRGGLNSKLFGANESPAEKLRRIIPNTSLFNGAVLETNQQADNWWGICHGTALASTLIDIPTDTSVYGGVDFFPYEIKAYAAQMLANYNSLVFFGLRTRAPEDVKVDSFKRPIDATARDINPGSFHLMLTNRIGIAKKTLLVDLRKDTVVLVFALYAFESKIVGEVKNPETIKRLKGYNPDATRFITVQTKVRYADSHRVIIEQPGKDYSFSELYFYILELNSTGEIIGGEWFGSDPHPDFAYFPKDNLDWKTLPGASDLNNILASSMRKPFNSTPYLSNPDNTVNIKL